MTSDTEKDITKRLILIRYMHRQAETYSELSGPRAVISVLMFHDAVDLWLQTAAHQLGVRTNQRNTFLLDYLKLIDKALKEQGEEGSELIHEYPIKRLNQARNSFKHNGVVPDAETIGAFRTYVRDFLQENTRTVFNLDFQSLSMIDLLEDGLVKEILILAREAVKRDDFTQAAIYATVGFKALVATSDYVVVGDFPVDLNSLLSVPLPGLPVRHARSVFSKEEILRRRSARRIMDFTSPLEKSPSKDRSSEELDLDGPLTEDELFEQLNRLSGRVSSLEALAFLIEYDINANEFRRFTMMAPPEYALSFRDGTIKIDPMFEDLADPADLYHDRDEAEFMMAFVADCAVQVQSRDAEYERAERWW